MAPEVRVFRDLVLWIFRKHEKPWDYKDAKAKGIYDEISTSTYQSISNDKELEGYLPNDQKSQAEFPDKKYLYLKPIPADQILVPLLTMSTNFDLTPHTVKIKLGVFLKHKNQLHAFGYRFESPEPKIDHHYYHLQPIRGFDTSIPFLTKHVNELMWFPERCPTIPLDASNSVSLLLALLISLYGKSYIITEVKQHISGIGSYLEQMALIKFHQISPPIAAKRKAKK